jgi:hypothetical protein
MDPQTYLLVGIAIFILGNLILTGLKCKKTNNNVSQETFQTFVRAIDKRLEDFKSNIENNLKRLEIRIERIENKLFKGDEK